MKSLDNTIEIWTSSTKNNRNLTEPHHKFLEANSKIFIVLSDSDQHIHLVSPECKIYTIDNDKKHRQVIKKNGYDIYYTDYQPRLEISYKGEKVSTIKNPLHKFGIEYLVPAFRKVK